MYVLLLTTVITLSACTHKLPVRTFNKVLDGYEYPYSVSKFKFNSQKQSIYMAYMDLNSESNSTIVLLHGKNFASYYWKQLAKSLADIGYRVIMPDQVGFGKSSKPDHYQYSFYQLANNTLQLLDSIGVEKFILLGHSMGGMLATHLTYYQPERVEKLILVNSIGLEPYLEFVEFKDPEFFYKIELKKSPETMRNYQRINYYDNKWNKDYESLLVPHIGQLYHKDWNEVAWHNALTYGPIFNEDITTKMPSINTPTRIINGTRDRTGPGRRWKKVKNIKLGQYQHLGKNTEQRFKKSKLYELEGLGHMPHFEDYTQFLETLKRALKE